MPKSALLSTALICAGYSVKTAGQLMPISVSGVSVGVGEGSSVSGGASPRPGMLGVGDGVSVGVVVGDGVGDSVADGVTPGPGVALRVDDGVGVKFAPWAAVSGRPSLCGSSKGAGGISKLTPRASTRSARTASGLAARRRRAGTSYLAAMLFHDSPPCTTCVIAVGAGAGRAAVALALGVAPLAARVGGTVGATVGGAMLMVSTSPTRKTSLGRRSCELSACNWRTLKPTARAITPQESPTWTVYS